MFEWAPVVLIIDDVNEEDTPTREELEINNNEPEEEVNVKEANENNDNDELSRVWRPSWAEFGGRVGPSLEARWSTSTPCFFYDWCIFFTYIASYQDTWCLLKHWIIICHFLCILFLR